MTRHSTEGLNAQAFFLKKNQIDSKNKAQNVSKAAKATQNMTKSHKKASNICISEIFPPNLKRFSKLQILN